jgi:hypothetical protein
MRALERVEGYLNKSRMKVERSSSMRTKFDNGKKVRLFEAVDFSYEIIYMESAVPVNVLRDHRPSPIKTMRTSQKAPKRAALPAASSLLGFNLITLPRPVHP